MAKSKSMCSGCDNDYYNRPGNSHTSECWCFQNAKVVERTPVGWWQNPPYKWAPIKTLNCKTQTGTTAFLSIDDVRFEPESA